MGLLTPACLVVVCTFVFLHKCDALFHWLHRLVFARLTFYMPPSDDTIRQLLPRAPLAALASQLPSKARKRLAKRAGIDPAALAPGAAADGDRVDLTLAAISSNLFAAAGNASFFSFHTYVFAHLALLAMVFVEQAFVCYNTSNVVQRDGSVAVQMGTHVTGTTAALLAVGLVYNLFIGLNMLRRAQSAGGVESGAASTIFRHRITFGLGFLMLILALSLQAMRPAGASLTSAFLGAADGPAYARYANALVNNALVGLHALAAKSQQAGWNTSVRLQDWLPALPTSVDSIHAERWLSLGAFKILLSLLCSLLSVSFFCSSWRYAKLVHAKLEENAEALAEDAVAAGAAASAPGAVSSEDAPMTRRARFSVYASSALHCAAFLSPLLVAMLWLPPLSSQIWMRIFAMDASAPGADQRAVAESALRAWRSFEIFRVACVWACALLRLAMVRSLLQVWLMSSLDVIKRMPAAAAAVAEQHVAVRMQAVLRAVFHYTPFAALQLVFPVFATLTLLAAWKLAEEWVPTGGGVALDAVLARGGWGVCYAALGLGWSPFNVHNLLPSTAAPVDAVPSAPAPAAAAAVPSRLTAALDADEFDGDLSSAEVHEPVVTVTSPVVTGAALTAASYTPGSFEAPNHSNILATALGFLLFWAHAVWFLQTALCICYLRYGSATPQVQKAAINFEPVSVPVDDSNKKQFEKAAAGLQQRRPGASS